LTMDLVARSVLCAITNEGDFLLRKGKK